MFLLFFKATRKHLTASNRMFCVNGARINELEKAIKRTEEIMTKAVERPKNTREINVSNTINK